jgi:putative hydrolase of the HAD superfamily
MARTLMLDVDGVLIHPRCGPHWSSRLERDLGINPAALHASFFVPCWEKIVTGRASLPDCLAACLPAIAPAVTPSRLMAYWFEQDSRIDHEVLQGIVALRALGMPVYLATNQDHARMRYLLDTLALRPCIDGWFHSAALGERKPQQAFFAAIQAHLAVPAPDLVLVDDSAENVAAARAAGWQAIQWTAGATLADLIA